MIEKDQTNRLNSDQKVLIKNLFSQGVKHKMKVNLGRQLSSKPSVWTRQLSVTSRAELESQAEEITEEMTEDSEAKKGTSDHITLPQQTMGSFTIVDTANMEFFLLRLMSKSTTI